MKRGSTIQEHGMSVDNIFENFPDFLPFFIDHFLGALYRFDHSSLDELSDDKRFEEFHSHLFRKSTLVQFAVPVQQR